MNSKIGYFILLLLFIIFTLGLFCFEHKILFYLYGLPQNLIHSDSPDSFAAYSKIAIGEKIFYGSTLLVSILFAIKSFYMWKKVTGLKYAMITILLGLSIFIILMLLFVLISFYISPSRIF